MQYSFQADKHLESGELEVVVKSKAHTPEVQALLNYLHRYKSENLDIIPLKTSDRIEMVKVSDIILVDVDGTDLLIDTRYGQLRTKERLYKLQERVNHPDLLQISKHALININHLDYLEDSFSGAMTAFLSNKIKTTVSRKYLKDLAKYLGL